MFYFFTHFYVPVLSIIDRGVLKSMTTITSFSISPFSLISFYLMYFESMLLIPKCLALLTFFDKWFNLCIRWLMLRIFKSTCIDSFFIYEVTFFILDYILCMKSTLFSINLTISAFFWLMLACYVFFILLVVMFKEGFL